MHKSETTRIEGLLNNRIFLLRGSPWEKLFYAAKMVPNAEVFLYEVLFRLKVPASKYRENMTEYGDKA